MVPDEPESMILEALFARLRALVLSPVLPVQWPDQDFSKPADGRYLRVQLIANTTTRLTISSDGPHQHMGIFQLTLVTPILTGELSARQEAGRIASWFPADLRMVFGSVMVRSTKRPSVADPYPDVRVTSDLLTPVSVEYEAYV